MYSTRFQLVVGECARIKVTTHGVPRVVNKALFQALAVKLMKLPSPWVPSINSIKRACMPLPPLLFWAWLLQTRADIPVQVHALQQRGSAPRKVDLQRAAALVKYVEAKPVGVWFPTLIPPVTLDLFSDSTFKGSVSIGSEGYAADGCSAEDRFVRASSSLGLLQ
eukprot:1894406-Amphidinium_carterae.2